MFDFVVNAIRRCLEDSLVSIMMDLERDGVKPSIVSP